MAFHPLEALVAGVWATLVMSVVLGVAYTRGWIRLEFGQLLGELLLPRGLAAEALGLVLHLGVGVLFALAYAGLFYWMDFPPDAHLMEIGALFGLFHWVLTMPLFSLARVLNPNVKKGVEPDPGTWGIHAGPQEAMWRGVGHVLFGATVGLVMYLAMNAGAAASAALFLAGIALWGAFMWAYLTRDRVVHPEAYPVFSASMPDENDDRYRERLQLRAMLDKGEITWDEYQHRRRQVAAEP